MKRRYLIVSFALLFVIFSSFGLVDATEVTLEPGYDDGKGWSGWGGSWDDVPGSGLCKIYMNAVGLPSSVNCWVGSKITLSSTQSIYMDADLDLTGYVGANWAGEGTVFVYLEVRRTDNERSEVWSVQVYSDVTESTKHNDYNDRDLNLNTNNFPKTLSAGTYYFCARIRFKGEWGAVFQEAEGDSDKGWLEVNSITVTY
ncbi:MAG: hypothetical protein GF309_09975 [Candidatus Lokiarchaeota archaeon]|nr:hypothetical protein [Candidatus Lokiarchaeota archaeon]